MGKGIIVMDDIDIKAAKKEAETLSNWFKKPMESKNIPRVCIATGKIKWHSINPNKAK